MIKINNTDYSKSVGLPYKLTRTLDETLDSGVLQLRHLETFEPFAPLTEVLIDDEKWLIANDSVVKTQTAGYNHNISIVEETKKLEGYFVGNITLTNSVNDDHKISVTDAVNKVLNRLKIRNMGEDPLFTFDTVQAAFYENVPMPDMTITNMNAFEALKQIGTVISALPRLKNGVLFFDIIGEKTVATFSFKQSTKEANSNINNYCSAIESYVSNLVINNSVCDPSKDKFKTLRVTENASVTIDTTTNASNLVIHTQYPIQKIISVKRGPLNATATPGIVADVTNKVVEKEVYDLLTTASAGENSIYEYLYFTRGERFIKGLWLANNLDIFPDTEGTIRRVCGSNSPAAVPDYNFIVTYETIVAHSIRQHKTHYLENKRFINMTQNETQVSSFELGKNLKTTVNRLGLNSFVRNFIVPKGTELPNCGEILNGEYITVLHEEHNQNYIKLSIETTPELPKISNFIGVNKQLRTFGLSNEMTVDCNIIYEDFAVIGDFESDNDEIITESGKNLFAKFLNNQTTGSDEDTGFADYKVANVRSKRYIGSTSFPPLGIAHMPVLSFRNGNSAIFSFKYNDNLNEGTQSSSEDLENIGETRRFQVKTGSYINPFSTRYKIGETLTMGFNIKEKPYQTLEEVFSTGHGLPFILGTYDTEQTVLSENSLVFYAPSTKRIVVDKDFREILNVSYQINFVTNLSNIIIGAISELLFINVNGCQLYTFDRQISEFEDKATDGTLVGTVANSVSGSKITFTEKTATENGKAWALLDADKNIILAQNIDFLNGASIQIPPITFTHNI